MMPSRRVLAVGAAVAGALPGPLYRAAVRALLRRNLARLRAGDPRPLLRTYAPDIRVTFPGQSSWSGTMTGSDELRAWLDRFVATGLQLYPETIVVEGTPRRTRIVIAFFDSLTTSEGQVVYENRGAICGEIRWGRLRSYDTFEDTERIAAFDRWLADRGDARAAAAVASRPSPPAGG